MFNWDNAVFRFLGKLIDVFLINILFIVCSLPIVTIVPSCSAMYYVALKLAKDTESYPVKSFFYFFKKNWKQGIGLSLILILSGLFLVFDIRLYIYFMNEIPGGRVLLVLMFVLLYMWTMVAVFVPAVFAQFDNTTKNLLKNSFLMAIAHLPKALLLVVMTIVLTALGIFIPILWFGLVAFLNSYVFKGIFKHYIPEDENKTPEEIVANNGFIGVTEKEEE